MSEFSCITRMCWQWLRRDIHVVLPSCAITKIRSTYNTERIPTVSSGTKWTDFVYLYIVYLKVYSGTIMFMYWTYNI